MPFTAGSVNMFLLSIFKWDVLDSLLITYRVGDFAMIVSLTVLLKKCRCVTEKWFLCVCLGYDWILWGVSLNICHILNSYTSKGINLAMPKNLSYSWNSVHSARRYTIAGVADMWNPAAAPPLPTHCRHRAVCPTPFLLSA